MASGYLSEFHPGCARVSIFVDEDISVAPGDHVDVLSIGKGQESITVLQNLDVVAEDQKVGVVELFVSPDDAQQITQASERGKFRLRLWKAESPTTNWMRSLTNPRQRRRFSSL